MNQEKPKETKYTEVGVKYFLKKIEENIREYGNKGVEEEKINLIVSENQNAFVQIAQQWNDFNSKQQKFFKTCLKAVEKQTDTIFEILTFAILSIISEKDKNIQQINIRKFELSDDFYQPSEHLPSVA